MGLRGGGVILRWHPGFAVGEVLGFVRKTLERFQGSGSFGFQERPDAVEITQEFIGDVLTEFVEVPVLDEEIPDLGWPNARDGPMGFTIASSLELDAQAVFIAENEPLLVCAELEADFDQVIDGLAIVPFCERTWEGLGHPVEFVSIQFGAVFVVTGEKDDVGKVVSDHDLVLGVDDFEEVGRAGGEHAGVLLAEPGGRLAGLF